jgi:MFS family permease
MNATDAPVADHASRVQEPDLPAPPGRDPVAEQKPSSPMMAVLGSGLVLFLAVFLMMAASGPLSTTISLRLQAASLPPVVIGSVMSGYYAGLTVGALVVHRIIRRAGHIRTFAAFTSILSGTSLIYALHLDPLLWGALRLVEGFCMAGIFVCIESWLNDSATAATRSKVMAVYMTSLYSGQAAGQWLLNLEDRSGQLLFIVISIILSLAVVPVALTRMAPAPLPEIAALSFRRLYGASPLGIVGTMTSGLILGSLFGLGPVFATAVGLDLSQTALFMSTIIFGGVLLQWPVGRLSDVFDRRLVIVSVLFAIALISGSMTLVAYNGGVSLFAVALALGGASFALYPLCVAQTHDYLSRADRVAGSGGLILAYSTGAILGPLAASSTMNVAGAASLFVFTGTASMVALFFALWRMTVRPSLATDVRAPYAGLPRTTPVVVGPAARTSSLDEAQDESAVSSDAPGRKVDHEG